MMFGIIRKSNKSEKKEKKPKKEGKKSKEEMEKSKKTKAVAVNIQGSFGRPLTKGETTNAWPLSVIEEAKRQGHYLETKVTTYVDGAKKFFTVFEATKKTKYRPLRYNCAGYATGTYNIATDTGHSMVTNTVLRVLRNSNEWEGTRTYLFQDRSVNLNLDASLRPGDVIILVKHALSPEEREVPQSLQRAVIEKYIAFHLAKVKEPVESSMYDNYDLSRTIVVDKPGEQVLTERSLAEMLEMYENEEGFHGIQIWRRKDGVYVPDNLQNFADMPRAIHGDSME